MLIKGSENMTKEEELRSLQEERNNIKYILSLRDDDYYHETFWKVTNRINELNTNGGTRHDYQGFTEGDIN